LKIVSLSYKDLCMVAERSASIGEEETCIEPFDIKPFRERPIFVANDSRAIVIDSVCFQENLLNGPLFIASAKSKDKGRNDLFSTFGEAFEAYANCILERMFNSKLGVLSKRYFRKCPVPKARDRQVEIDGILTDANAIAVFEIKSVFMRENEALSINPSDYLEHLDEQYAERKGVGQLARNIRALLETRGGVNSKNIHTIFPVLLVRDSLLDEILHSHHLNIRFTNLLKAEKVFDNGTMFLGGLTVFPVIVISITDLENLEFSVKNFSFIHLLNDYANHRIKASCSFHNYLCWSEKYRDRIFRNARLENLEKRILQKMSKKFFGQSDFLDKKAAR
jgi:hypothetical protein